MMDTWNLIKEWISASPYEIKVWEANNPDQSRILEALGITTQSVLGSTLANTAGISIDSGWLRFFGSSPSIDSDAIYSWNLIDGFPVAQRYVPGALLFAYDVLGGFFGINAGAFPGPTGNVFYLAPETLVWEDLESTHSNFVEAMVCGGAKQFYENCRWPLWEQLSLEASAGNGIHLYPPLWAAGQDISRSSKKIVPLTELWDLSLPQQGLSSE